jgi:hypothetical protein
MKSASLLLAVALFAGCSTTLVRETPEPVRVADGVQLETTSLVEALLGFKGTRVQAANGAWKGQVFSAQCVLKGDGETFKAVFLAPQLRLLTITLTKPHTITYERAPQVPRAFEPEYALADLAYVNLDADTLRRAVAPTLSVEDDGTTRRIKSGDTLVADLVRRPNGDVDFRNVRYGYSYTLRTVTP